MVGDRSYNVGYAPSTNIQSVFNMTLSQMGPKIIPQFIDMTIDDTVLMDTSPFVQNGNIDFISGAWIDNSENAEILTVSVFGSNQLIDVPPESQGYFPMLSPNTPKFTFSCPTSPGIIIPVIFYNIPLLPYLWNKNGNGGGGGPTGDVNIAGTSISDGSLILSGVSETLFVANPDRKILTIQNIGIYDIGVNFTGGVANLGDPGTYLLEIGTTLTFDTNCPTNQINVIGEFGEVVSAFEG